MRSSLSWAGEAIRQLVALRGLLYRNGNTFSADRRGEQSLPHAQKATLEKVETPPPCSIRSLSSFFGGRSCIWCGEGGLCRIIHAGKGRLATRKRARPLVAGLPAKQKRDISATCVCWGSLGASATLLTANRAASLTFSGTGPRSNGASLLSKRRNSAMGGAVADTIETGHYLHIWKDGGGKLHIMVPRQR